MVIKKEDDLAAFLQKNTSNEPTPDKEKGDFSGNKEPEKVNLIEKAIEESNQGGRPELPEEEKANKRLICYVNSSTKEKLTKKRGLISESKLLGILVEKYISGEITLQ